MDTEEVAETEADKEAERDRTTGIFISLLYESKCQRHVDPTASDRQVLFAKQVKTRWSPVQ